MAQGTVGLFDEFIRQLGDKEHDLDADVFKAGIIDSVQTPVASATDARWGAGGTVNFDTNEVTETTGAYAAEGLDISATWSEAAGTATFDATDITTWTQNANNPVDARWIIIYNSTASGKFAVGWVDLGADFNMTTGDLNVTWNGSGIFTVS